MYFKASFYFLFFFLLNLYAITPVDTKIFKIENNEFYIQNNNIQTKIGASAVVIQNIAGVETAIARVSVNDMQDEFIKLKLEEYDIIKQEALPRPDTKIQVGDTVRLNFLYDRAMLIAPNEQSYNEVEAKFNQIYFLHPDILGAYMIREYKLSPKKEDFELMCSNNALGLIVFALEKSVVFVDCWSFSILYENEFNFSSTEVQTPFYSRIDGYQKVIFNFFESRVKDYYAYYKKLIGYKDES